MKPRIYHVCKVKDYTSSRPHLLLRAGDKSRNKECARRVSEVKCAWELLQFQQHYQALAALLEYIRSTSPNGTSMKQRNVISLQGGEISATSIRSRCTNEGTELKKGLAATRPAPHHTPPPAI